MKPQATQSVHGAPERGLDRHGYPLWLEREASLNHLFDRYRLHFLSNLPRVPALAPLRPAELKDLSEILSARARTSLESYYEESGLNQAPDILEADLAESRESIQRAYDQSDRSMEAFIAWDEGQRALDLQLQAGLEHYSSMYRFSNGAGLSHAVIPGLVRSEPR